MLPDEQKNPSQKDPLNYINWLLNHSLEDIPVTGITSRDQIIDPYVVVGDPSSYGFTRKGKARYEAALGSAKLIQQQQEAAYKEWYDSEEQQAARQRAAGLNPDLQGVQGSQSATAGTSEIDPMSGVPTNGEVALTAFNMLTSLVGAASSAASLATSFSGISLNKLQGDVLKGQADALAIGNVQSFMDISRKTITDRLSTAMSLAANAGEVFDIASFFSDESNFADIVPMFAPEDSPRYHTALASVRKGIEPVLSNAYKQNQETGQNRLGFAKVLSDPYHSTDAVLSAAFMMPVMDALRKMEKAQTVFAAKRADAATQIINGTDLGLVSEAIDAGNSKSAAEAQFYEDYYNAADGMEWSEADFMLKSSEAIAKGAAGAIYKNLWSIYENDPTSVEGLAAGYMIQSGLHLNWKEYLVANSPKLVREAIDFGKSFFTVDFSDRLTPEEFISWLNPPTN